MGKNKNKPKAKTRPSSSMHSAELLSSAGAAATPVMIGFQNYPLETSGLGTPGVNLEEESNGNVRVIVKTMLKKDAVTKLKGIQEFTTFCSSDPEAAMSFLPYFPRIYNKLAVETNPRVREAIQKALEMYIPMLKKDIAPYLKSIMATWLITQCDPCAGAASAAQSAFLKAFPEHKQSDAVMFCHSEILNAIKDNVCVLTYKTLNENSGLTEDVCREKYELVLICSIRGLKLFISLLSEEDKGKVIQPISIIVNDKRFWAHSQSTINKVRIAWYELLHTTASDMPEVFQERKDLISLVMSSLWKGDSQVIRSIWDCALKVFSTFKDWWCQIDVSSMVFVPLFEFLSSGGYGNAAVVYPMLPNFLRHLMAVDDVGLNFFMEFFSSLRKSFSAYKLKASPKECDAVMQGFFDCLQFVNDSLLKDCNRLNDTRELIDKQLIPLVQYSFKSEGSNVAATSFYALLGLYLQDLEVCVRNNPTKKLEDESPYCNILTYIWERLSSEIISYLNTEVEGHDKDVSVLILLFHSLHQPSKYLKASEQKLYFYGESSTSIDTNYFVIGNSPNIISKPPASCDSPFLFGYTVGLCEHLCSKIERNIKDCYLELFAELISDANCEQTFWELLQALHVPVNSVVQAPFVFFRTVVMDWIRRARTSVVETLFDWIRDIVMCICFCVETECAVVILNICSVYESQKMFQRLVGQMLEFGENSEELFCQWLYSPTFICVFEFMTARITRVLMYGKLDLDNPETAQCIKSLMLCFAKVGSEQSQTPWQQVKNILVNMSYVLCDEYCMNCEFEGAYNMIDFICDAAEKLFFQYPSAYLAAEEISDFVFKAFTLSLEWIKFDFPDTHKELRQLDYLWSTYVAHAIVKQSDLHKKNFLVMASEHLHGLLLKGMPKKKQRRVIEVACAFLGKVAAAYGNMSADKYDSVLTFLIRMIMPSCKEWEEARHGLHMGTAAEIIKDNWLYPFIKDDLLPICTATVPPIILMADAVVELLQNIWTVLAEKSNLEAQVIYHSQLCYEYLPNALWALCYADAQKFFNAQDIKEPAVFSTLKENFIFLMERCDLSQLMSVLSFKLLEDHVTWAVPFEKFLPSAIREHVNPFEYFPGFYFTCKERSNLTLMQICIKYAKQEFVEEFLSNMNEDPFSKEFYDVLLSNKDFCGTVSQLASCTEHHGLKFSSVIQNKVATILTNLMRSEWFCECNHDDVVLITSFTSVAVHVIKDARTQMSSDLLFSLMEVIMEWFQKCLGMADLALKDVTHLIFVQKTCRLISAMSEIIEQSLEEQKGYSEATVYWKTLFENKISKQLVKLFLNFAGKISEFGHTSCALEKLLFDIIQTLEYLSKDQIFEAVVSIRSGSSSSLSLYERIDSAYEVLRDEFTHHLKSKSVCVQFGIHFLLKKVLVYLPEIDERQRTYDDDDAAEHETRFKSLPLVEMLENTNELIEMVLTKVKPTDCCVLRPFSDSFTFTMANLLAWHIFVEYFSAFLTEERSVYLGCLADSKMLSCMLMNVVRLRPENPVVCSGHIPKKAGSDDVQEIDLHEIPPMYSLDAPSSNHLQHAACSVYVTALKKIPALVRTWWSNLDKRTADIVEKFTSEHISKLLILNEINAIHENKDQFVNMTVDAFASSRQVVATYTLGDATIELSIKIPHNYPLGPVSASSKKRNIVDPNQWRSWMFQLSTFLNYHNGSIKDALLLWKKNLDKKFEGVEECMICYFILHSSSGTLPNKTCRICRKKFHGSCLFKWFKTSNSCSCPGCRNDF